MIALKMMLMIAGVSLMAAALVFPLYGLWMRIRYAQMTKSRGDGTLLDSGTAEPEPASIPWRRPLAMALVACLPLLIATSMVVVPSGMGGAAWTPRLHDRICAARRWRPFRLPRGSSSG